MAVDVLGSTGGRATAQALVAPARSWTYAQLDDSVDARTLELRRAGVESGRVTPVVVEPDADGIITLLAHWRLGSVPAPLNPKLTQAEVASATASLSDAPPGGFVVVWTSGTGGRPRGVALSFDNFVASARAAEDRLGLGRDEVWLASLSPAHVGGLASITRSILLGGTLVAPGGFDASTVNDLLDGRGSSTSALPITQMSLVPTQLVRLLDRRRGAPAPDALRCVLVGGAHAPAELVARAHRAGWPLALTYGATEMCSQVATATPELTRRKPGTVGAPLRDTEVRVAADGEILVRGPTRALAYIPAHRASTGDQADAAEAIADADGWYHTGDLGRLDDEGHLWITGRRQDRIVSGGVTIDAVEVEDALRGHPSVIDVCAVGLPDAEWGERVGVWVEAVAGEFDQEQVEDHVRAILSGPKLPRVWYLGSGLPRNPNGKVDRARVRAVLSER